MRCPECGYQNDDNVTECVKCGTKLGRSSTQDSTSPNFVPTVHSNSGGTNPTIKGNIANQPAWDDNAPQNKENYLSCPECGHYPLQHPVSSTHPCPNCSYSAADNGSAEFKTKKLENVDFGTEDYTVTLTEIHSEEANEFQGKSISLNRNNLDPQNESISSNHAELKFKNGSWVIKDLSSNNATFVQVQDEAPIPNGSNIIIGNRIFRVDY